MTAPGDLRDLRDVLVAGVIEKLAPKELSLVGALRGLDDRTTLKLLTKPSRRAESLGVEPEPASTRLTPVVWIAVDESVRRVVAARPGPVRRRLFTRRRDPVPVSTPTLTSEQLEMIARCVRDAAQEANLSREHAVRIADGVVRRLAAMQPADGL